MLFRSNVCSDKENVFGFIRKGFEDNIYGIFNLSEETRTIAVPVLKSVQCKEIFGTQSWDVLEDKKRGYINEDILEYKGEIEIKLAPYSMKVIKQTYGGKKE